MINALSHRDYYDRGGKIVVELFDDRVEITNPGGLVSAIKPSEFGYKSHSRNPLVFGLFNRINMVEQIGSGIGRITRELEKFGQQKPVYKTDGLFTVIFKRTDTKGELGAKLGAKLGTKLGINEQKIFDAIQNNPNTTIIEIANQIGISTTSIENNIKKLKNKQIIARVGSNKNGHWKILVEK